MIESIETALEAAVAAWGAIPYCGLAGEAAERLVQEASLADPDEARLRRLGCEAMAGLLILLRKAGMSGADIAAQVRQELEALAGPEQEG